MKSKTPPIKKVTMGYSHNWTITNPKKNPIGTRQLNLKDSSSIYGGLKFTVNLKKVRQLINMLQQVESELKEEELSKLLLE